MKTSLSRAQRHFFPLLLLALLAPPAIAAESQEERCARVQPIADIEFQGRVLRSTPDIKAPELRRADALLSARCHELYQQIFDDYVAKHPEDEDVWFLYARQSWIYNNLVKTKAMMRRAQVKRPEFTSMKVLQASLAIDENQLEEAEKLLAEVEKEQPQDLWLFMNQLRLDVLLTPSSATSQTLLAILDNPAFPGSVREQSFQSLQRFPRLPAQAMERAYRAQLTFESATPYEMKALNLAFYLIDLAGKPADAHAVLDKLDGMKNTDRWKEFKVDAYLMEAVQPGVTARRQQALVNEAGKVVNNDWALLESRMTRRPEVVQLQKYVPAGTVAETKDQYGRTVLCDAVMASNFDAVLAALRRGGDANGRCESWSLVNYMLVVGWSREDEQTVRTRQNILRALLRAGGRAPDPVGDCTLGCEQYLIPVLKEFGHSGRK